MGGVRISRARGHFDIHFIWFWGQQASPRGSEITNVVSGRSPNSDLDHHAQSSGNIDAKEFMRSPVSIAAEH